jgi:hypothetical protein
MCNDTRRSTMMRGAQLASVMTSALLENTQSPFSCWPDVKAALYVIVMNTVPGEPRACAGPGCMGEERPDCMKYEGHSQIVIIAFFFFF